MIALIDRIFDEQNLRSACLTVAKSMRRAASTVPNRPKRYYAEIARLESTPNDVGCLIRHTFLNKEGSPFRRLVRAIPKKPGGRPERPISLFSVEERVLFRATLIQLWPEIEQIIIPSIAYCTFRKEGLHEARGVAAAVAYIREARRDTRPYIFETDIEGFFDRINRDKLLATIAPYLPDDSANSLLAGILKAETVLDPRTMRDIAFDPTSGVPQGSALSPLLACAYLSPFDEAMQREGWRMIRYVDDLVVLCGSQEECYRAGEVVAGVLLREYGLSLKKNKTKPVPPGKPLDFLGHTVSSNGKVLPNTRRMKALADGVYQRVALLPARSDDEVAQELTSYLLGFFGSMRYCDFSEWHYRHAAQLVRRALRARGLSERRLGKFLLRSKKWPSQFVDEMQ